MSLRPLLEDILGRVEGSEMSVLDIGRICVKRLGREAGKKCVIIDIVDKSFVLVTGPEALTGVKRRRVNMGHIEPTKDSLKIARRASDEDVVSAAKAQGKAGEMKAEAKPSS